jgi:hypothetical protein
MIIHETDAKHHGGDDRPADEPDQHPHAGREQHGEDQDGEEDMHQSAYSVVFEMLHTPTGVRLEMHGFDQDDELVDTWGTVLPPEIDISGVCEGTFWRVSKIPERCAYQRDLARRAGLPE